MTDILKKEDYAEPCCPLNMHPGTAARIPVGRVIDRLDALLDKNDYAGAERHLRYWLGEADLARDGRGRLTILNEQIGLYRKMDRPDEGMTAIRGALALAEELGLGESVTMGTTLVNAATGYKHFGMAEQALPLYRRAQALYESLLAPDDAKLGGLYNNMALTLTDLSQFGEARAMFEKAMAIMEKQPNGEAEMAITCLNLVDLTAAEQGAAGKDAIRANLQRAAALLDTESLPRDGYYAFVCEKCAPIFGYYGMKTVESTLQTRAREIYERP